MKKFIVILLFCHFILSSCSTVRESAGVNRKNIDEYKVVENPPLVIPPDFYLLPPEQLAKKNIDDAESELAKEILFGCTGTIGESFPLEKISFEIPNLVKKIKYTQNKFICIYFYPFN